MRVMPSRRRALILPAVAAACLLLAAGCTLPTAPAGGAPAATPAAARMQPPPGYAVTPLVEGLVGPTQMIAGPNGTIWVAQLNGGENAGQGQVLAISPVANGGAAAAQRVVVEGLRKPTGIALLDGALWVATQRDLLRFRLDAQGRTGPSQTILADLPFNGRSNGTLTVTPQQTLLYETSGAQRGGQVVEGSATLWELDPAAPLGPANPRPLATGLKGAYAHTFDAAGRLWTTEIGDDPVNGGPPPDELNLVEAGADYGWPACFGIREPAANLGGTAERCAATRAPVALFPPRSTPVAVLPSPWAPDTLLVALWLQNEVVAVPVPRAQAAGGDSITADTADTAGNAAGNTAGTVQPWLTGIVNPQSLLAWGVDGLLVLEYATGTIVRVVPE